MSERELERILQTENDEGRVQEAIRRYLGGFRKEQNKPATKKEKKK